MPTVASDSDSYAKSVGLVYVFNIIVGTGALALPKSFQDSGYILGPVTLALSCFVSFIGATFILEGLAGANAVIHARRQKYLRHINEGSNVAVANDSNGVATNNDESDEESEKKPLLVRSGSELSLNIKAKDDFFEITKRIEISEMAKIFLGKAGVVFFYLCLIVYLFGDLAIYCALVPKSLMTVVCSKEATCDFNGTSVIPELSDPCFGSGNMMMTRFTVYRLFVVLFVLLIGPFVFFNVTSTKYLQMLTTATRWIALILMIVLGLRMIIVGQGEGNPTAANFSSFGSLFGVTVYAFMCHHSLPAVITPMRNKTNIHGLFAIVFVGVCIFYAMLAVSGSFAFRTLEDVYTLNFFGPCGPRNVTSVFLLICDYFLTLFPVFTLSASWPILGITLRNNLRSLFFGTSSVTVATDENSQQPLIRSRSLPSVSNFEDNAILRQRADSHEHIVVKGPSWDAQRMRVMLSKYFVPFCVIIPPLIVAISTDNVQLLASITGSYAGVCVEFVLPSMLVLAARKQIPDLFGAKLPYPNASPFSNPLWPIFLLVWSVLTIVIVTVNLAMVGLK